MRDIAAVVQNVAYNGFINVSIGLFRVRSVVWVTFGIIYLNKMDEMHNEFYVISACKT